MNISKVIEEFGYKPNEVKVYLATLKVEEATASGVAVRAKLSLSSTQMALEKLHKNGLVNFYVRKNRKYWVAESPGKLVQIFKNKEEKLAVALKSMDLPEKINKDKPAVKVFLGADEIKLIHDSIIQKKHNICAIVPLEGWYDLLGQDYVKDFINQRVEHQLNIRMLAPRTLESSKLKKRDERELRTSKFLPHDILIEDALFIFGNNVAIITLNEEQPTGVVIRDPATSRMLKIFFEELWGRSENE